MNMQFCAPPNFAPAFGFAHGQGPAVQYPEGQYPVHPGYHGLQYMYGYQQPRGHLMADRNGLGDGKTESKPRLSKEEVEKLEKVFQENPKPSSAVKAQLADGLGVERPRINNWFQNRRAKAKQDRKQEEYEARRAAEKSASEPKSPGDDNASRTSEYLGENTPRRVQPSSALFPDLSSASQGNDSSCDDQDEDEAADGHDIGSSYVEPSKPQSSELANDFQSPLSLDFSSSDIAVFSHEQSQDYAQSQPMGNYTPFMSSQNHAEHFSHEQQPATFSDNMSSPGDQSVACEQPGVHQYPDMMGAGFSNSAAMFFPPQSGLGASEIEEAAMHDGLVHSSQRSDHSTHLGSHGMPTPTDSFKSPPPPANIASRRNIPRPAALQSASLRNRSYNLGCGPKSAMDGSKRVDPSSPVSAMRRISSGNIPSRIQKSSVGPRSPMVFTRNPEVLLQYHARSPVGSTTSTFPGAAPPTPMTPAVVDQQFLREPTVSSTCSDDGSLMLGGVVSPNIMQELKTESNLKTPPSTPGLMTNFATHNFNVNPFGAGVDFSTDQPLFTPYYHTEFPELSLRNVPSYVELNDGSVPATPMYPNMVGSIHEHSAFGGTTMGNTQYDWDANESVISPKSSPGQPRSKQIQFTQNMTPQDYTTHQEK